ncbi:MAG TPA: hypothetical protein PLY87_22830 [Planctomycetaceae bacterium]|nr:hypothetical protein [Planctomycetaceae bacterium]HQZ67951.1 hypothetical protein [Planctomycetaceae bacterium]HRA89635.1 hypothetical protein [Planctomycetaceae bacterium]
MTEPIVEQIMANVKSRMDAVFAAAYRSTQVATWQPKDLVVHVHQGALIPNAELSCPGNPPAQAYDLEAIIAGIVKPSDRETIAVDTFRNRMGAEIIRAATNAELWHQWGSLAINTTIGPVEDYTEESGGFAGVMVRFRITFRTDEDDPYTVRA